MLHNQNSLVDFIFEIAEKLRGPYRPPQYRKVMLPMTVLRRLDLVTRDNKQEVIDKYNELKAKGLEDDALHQALGKVASPGRNYPL